MEVVKNPLEDVKAGLLDSSGQQVPLQAVHVKCKLMDLLSQVGTLLSLSVTVLIVGFVSCVCQQRWACGVQHPQVDKAIKSPLLG